MPGQVDPGLEPVELKLASIGARPQPMLNVRDAIHRERVQVYALPGHSKPLLSLGMFLVNRTNAQLPTLEF